LILLHGRAVSELSSPGNSITSFSIIQRRLVTDGFIDGGTILPSDPKEDFEKGILGRYHKPIVVTTTYYVDTKILDINSTVLSSKREDIQTYAQRLETTIELVKHKTGAPKVNILAHSMGGLVAREYLRIFGEDSVNKLIMVGTPNHGVEGPVESLCLITSTKEECAQLISTGQFINELNAVENKPTKTKTYVLYGTGCLLNGKQSDGFILADNAKLPFALNFPIAGNCNDKILHEEIKNVNTYPEVYQIIQNILQN
jgi:hypothetical protein